MGEYVSTLEAAQIIGCSGENIRALARRGLLAVAIVTRAGRLFRRDEVQRYATARRARGTASIPATSGVHDDAPAV